MTNKNVFWMAIGLLVLSLISASTFTDSNIEIRQGDTKITEKLEYPNCYNTSLRYKNNKISIESIEVVPCKLATDLGYYSINIINNKKQILKSNNFVIPNVEIYDYFDLQSGKIIGGDVEISEEVSFDVLVPYDEDAEKIIIYDSDGKEIAKKEIKEKDFIDILKKYWIGLSLLLLLIAFFYFIKNKKLIKKTN